MNDIPAGYPPATPPRDGWPQETAAALSYEELAARWAEVPRSRRELIENALSLKRQRNHVVGESDAMKGLLIVIVAGGLSMKTIQERARQVLGLTASGEGK